LGTGVDTFNPNTEKVALMTLHSAKGLEFKCVFIVGCENGLLPYSLFENQTTDLDEEKRLFYVGMTRTKRFLFLSYAKKRFLLGKQYCLGKSPYLNIIENELVELSKTDYKIKPEARDAQMKLFEI